MKIRTRKTPKHARTRLAAAHLGCRMLDSHRYREALDCFERALGQTAVVTAGRECEAPCVQRAATALLAEMVSQKPAWATGQFSLGAMTLCTIWSADWRLMARPHLGQCGTPMEAKRRRR